MPKDPYINHLLDQAMPCTDKAPVLAQVNAVLHARAEKRGLELAAYPSRAVLQHEVHELILTGEDARPGSRVDVIAYVCFFELSTSGILWQGDHVILNGREIGLIAGYEFSHMPNHMNIVVKAHEKVLTGFEMKLKPGDPIEFRFGPTIDN